MKASYHFPKGFLWGTATSSHQVEGGNTNNNWSAWESSPGQDRKRGEGRPGLRLVGRALAGGFRSRRGGRADLPPAFPGMEPHSAHPRPMG